MWHMIYIYNIYIHIYIYIYIYIIFIYPIFNIPWTSHETTRSNRLDAQVQPQGTKGVKFEEPVHEAMGEPGGPIPVWNPWRSMNIHEEIDEEIDEHIWTSKITLKFT